MKVLGVVLCVLGAALGLFLGVWVMLIGGVVQAIEGVKATPVESLDVALGVFRVIFAGAVGWLSAIIFILPGAAMVSGGGSKRKKKLSF